jgi:hypothetical protein
MVDVCKDCGTVGEPARKTRGSFVMEVVLWLCFIIPGIIYSMWRLTTRYDACPACGGVNLVPLSTPAGARLAADAGYQAPPAYRGSPAAEDFGRKIGRLFAKKR